MLAMRHGENGERSTSFSVKVYHSFIRLSILFRRFFQKNQKYFFEGFFAKIHKKMILGRIHQGHGGFISPQNLTFSLYHNAFSVSRRASPFRQSSTAFFQRPNARLSIVYNYSHFASVFFYMLTFSTKNSM